MTERAELLVARPAAGVVQLTLNRPEKRNALATPLLGAVAAALAEAAGDGAVACAVLTGGPQVFAAGADINELAVKTPVMAETEVRGQHWATIRVFPKPLIAAIEGFCLGGGLELALCADIVVAGEGARFGTPEINLGIMPGGGGTQWLPRIVGKSLAMKMVLSGQPIGAEEALAAGLIAELAPAGEATARALALAETIAAKPAFALRIAKDAVLKAYSTAFNDGLAYERRSFAVLLASEDKAEGTTAFIEKRKPQFKGR
ncbi:MAG: enoyl-CoA hydratase-related protein [Alphaproteobacteria bacterium]